VNIELKINKVLQVAKCFATRGKGKRKVNKKQIK
jgi:hypothetical protein